MILSPERVKINNKTNASHKAQKTNRWETRCGQKKSEKLKLLYQANSVVYKSDKNAMNNIGHEGTNE